MIKNGRNLVWDFGFSAYDFLRAMAKITVEIHPWLTSLLTVRRRSRKGFVVQEHEVAEGVTIRDLLEKLVAQEEKLRPHLFDPSGRFTDQVSIVVNDRYMDLLDGLETRLKDGDRLMLFQAWSGG